MQNRMFLALATAILAVPLTALAAADGPPKNVIVMIGDGMGLGQVTAARITKGSLHLERCTVGGFSATQSSNSLVTDSAAGGTAIATGQRTNNGMVATAPDGAELKGVLDYAEDAGKATGIVVTSAVTHATPAAFVAHADDRGQQTLIAEQLVAGGTDVILGGGWAFFAPQSEKGSKRKDDKNLVAELSKRMPVALTAEQLRALGDVDAFAGLLAPEHLMWAEERDPSLPEMVTMALKALSKDPDGFALMVEGSHIDWAASANQENHVLGEMTDFDEAIGAALDFAQADGNTLVVVTSDHDTGAYAVLDGSLADRTITKSAFASKGHTPAMVPVFAYGPGAEVFGGILDNEKIGKALVGYMQQAAAPAKEEATP